MKSDSKSIKIAIVGKPNCGKSTVFNTLTGMNQKTGNFPGVTVDKKWGEFEINNITISLIDLPGTYSLYPKSIDEEITTEILTNSKNEDYPDAVLFVADASNLKQCLFLCSQIIDLKIPTLLALNMIDVANEKNIIINEQKLQKELGINTIAISAVKNIGIEDLKELLASEIETPVKPFYGTADYSEVYSKNKQNTADETWRREQLIEIKNRYDKIKKIVSDCVLYKTENSPAFNNRKLDRILTHKLAGPLILFAVLFLLFQLVYVIAQWPMDLIENTFNGISQFLNDTFKPSLLLSLITNGLIAGLSGVLIFVPQIAILFAFLSLLEDSGYLARVTFMSDRLMRQFGFNGRSVFPLLSGIACAVPAIMSTRTISNKKERLITILVTPLMSCSARLPVFTVIIALIIPSRTVAGIFNVQGIVLFLLYLIGFIAALIMAAVLNKIIKSKEQSYFIMELPNYKIPTAKNSILTVWEKVKIFVIDAGKVILMVSLMLWALSSFGPGETFKNIEAKYFEQVAAHQITPEQGNLFIASEKLENSYAGILGKTIEPVIKPLGFDWKLGIAIISSFAAREIFVGTMSTIYNVGNTDDTLSLVEKMRAAKWDDSGQPVYTFAAGISLLLFYVFAMQCISTLAVVYRETHHLKWPVIQFLYMGVLAYLTSLIAYTLLS